MLVGLSTPLLAGYGNVLISMTFAQILGYNMLLCGVGLFGFLLGIREYLIVV